MIDLYLTGTRMQSRYLTGLSTVHNHQAIYLITNTLEMFCFLHWQYIWMINRGVRTMPKYRDALTSSLCWNLSKNIYLNVLCQLLVLNNIPEWFCNLMPWCSAVWQLQTNGFSRQCARVKYMEFFKGAITVQHVTEVHVSTSHITGIL